MVLLRNCVLLGAAGYAIEVGAALDLTFDRNGGRIAAEGDRVLDISYAEIVEINIGGPGEVTKGGGFIGGGFGFDGAVQGMAIAAALNLLTTRTKIHTFVTLITNHGEIHIHYGEMEPNALRIRMAPVFSALRWLEPAWAARRMQAASIAAEVGLLDHEQTAAINSRLAQSPWDTVVATTRVVPDAHSEFALSPAVLEGPQGRCPNCKTVIALASTACPKCKAIFTLGSAWSVQPL